MPDDAMNVTRKPAMKVGYASEKKPVMVGGRRDFFAYRDLGIGEASGGTMRGQVMKAKTGMTQPTGWHYHTCDGQFVYALKGWVELEFESGETLRLEPGDSVFIPGGMAHNELRTSDDVEILEVSVPGELGTVACDRRPPAADPGFCTRRVARPGAAAGVPFQSLTRSCCRTCRQPHTLLVVPAEAGTHNQVARAADPWIPAFAGITRERGKSAELLI